MQPDAHEPPHPGRRHRLLREPAGRAVEVQAIASVPLAVVRRQATPGQLAALVPECCGIVWQAVKAQKAAAGRHVAICWDDSIRLEVGVELLGPFDDDGEVVRSETPGGMVASLTHLGPYHLLGAAHDAVRAFCETHGHRLAGPSWEIYGHWRPEWDADPSAIRTDVCYLLAD
jgi:effector-binding domain-containing protein